MESREDQPRYFRPALVGRQNETYLVVDEVQPFAVALSEHGNVLGEISWNHLEPPKAWSWPPREIVVDDSSAWVRDLPDGPVVRITRSSAAEWHATPTDPAEIPDTARRKRSRFAMPRAVRVVGERRWAYTPRLDGFQWEASVNTDQLGEDRGSWALGPGSITCVAETEGAAAVCIRRAAKRPWDFHADHEMFLLEAGHPHARTALRRDSIDIRDRAWDAPQVDATSAVSRYLPYTLSEAQAARREGATEVSITIEEPDNRPLIKITFTLDGRRYERVDEPIDELGRLAGGLRDLGIFLAEDLRAPEILQRPPTADGVIRI
ncbi:hypothetical protein [Pseudonocardia sp. MH-G8]|uniref:hypothetical protein n=1 Tax=Pseudonocardia sp. MH-G8 TaxID=1854588 RepID=UPI000BA00DDE|nr:hypothetical protein [Pseudonocardia sp. MH-G8]OZM83494.1 hypothetical protein CFP66_03015 [Pseudonocardia sp. MH-G8]